MAGSGNSRRLATIALAAIALIAIVALLRLDTDSSGFLQHVPRDQAADQSNTPATPDSGKAVSDKTSSRPSQDVESPFLNTQIHVKYTGSIACADCHADQYQSYINTHHSHSLSLVNQDDEPPDGTVEHAASRRRYLITRRNGEFRHQEIAICSGGTTSLQLADYPTRYQVGSGQVARSYLIQDDGFLIQSPVTWYENLQQWDMSPGYEGSDQSSFGRVIGSGCLFCHAGHLTAPDQNAYRHHITELSIGCERCHGPGEQHVAVRSGDLNASVDLRNEDHTTDRTIVNPSHLSRALSESVCSQCHLNGDVNVSVSGRQAYDYRPGLPLEEFRLEYRRAVSGDNMKIAGHVEQLHESACYKKSETLTCITCHNPHVSPDQVGRVTEMRAICLNCHATHSCTQSIDARISANEDNCVACHMPHAETEVTHVALTHHRIGLHPPVSPSAKATATTSYPPLIPLQSLEHLSAVEQNRALGLAHLKLVRMSGRSPDQMDELEYAASLLRNAHKAGVNDPETLTALASIARDGGHLDIGMALARQAVQSPEITAVVRIEAIDILAELYFRSGRYREAGESLEQIVAEFRSPLHWFLLARIARESRQTAKATVDMRKAVELSPGTPEYHLLLAELLQQQGLSDDADKQKVLADLLRKK